MERVTFREPTVQETLAEYVLLKLDVDALKNRELCRSYRRHSAVPEFAILDANGRAQHRWVGALQSEALIAALRQAPASPPVSSKTGIDRHRELAEFYLEHDDHTRAAEHLGAIRKLDHPNRNEALRHLMWLECESLRENRRFEQLALAAKRYLAAFPEDPQADEAKVRLGVAQVETGGTATPELLRRIEELITVLGVPFPNSDIKSRALRLFGVGPETSSEAATRWVDTANDTTDQLVSLGRAASGPLRTAILGSNLVAANRAAAVLGSMRLPETRDFLLEHWGDPRLYMGHRRALVRCMGIQNHPAFLDLLIDCLQTNSESTRVRNAAGYSIRNILVNRGGSTRVDLARAVESGLRHSNARLRAECLQVANQVHAAIDLELLIDLLSDRRIAFLDYRVCDNALWVLYKQIGQDVHSRSSDGPIDRCTPALLAFLQGWYRTNGDQLHWDLTERRYRKARWAPRPCDPDSEGGR